MHTLIVYIMVFVFMKDFIVKLSYIIKLNVILIIGLYGQNAISSDYFIDSIYNDDIVNMEKFIRKNPWMVNEVFGDYKITPLHAAVDCNAIDYAKVLIEEYHANVNVQDINGETPLHIAAKDNYLNIIDLLLQSNADISLRNNFDKTAQDLEISQEAWQLLENERIVRKNVENKYNAADRNSFGG
jgi:ankyrin repeat protein